MTHLRARRALALTALTPLLLLGASTAALADDNSTDSQQTTTIAIPALAPLSTIAHPVTLGGIGCCWD